MTLNSRQNPSVVSAALVSQCEGFLMCAEGKENMDEDVEDVCGHPACCHEGESSEAHASSSIQRRLNGRVLFSRTGTAVKLTEALLEKKGGK